MKPRRRKGALSVEAAIILPLFALCVIAFALLVNTLHVRAEFEKNVALTVERLADTAYPLSFLNDAFDELTMNGGEASDVGDSIITDTGDIDVFGVVKQILPDAIKLVPKDVIEKAALGYFSIKSKVIENSAKNIFLDLSGESFNKDDLSVDFVYMPLSITEFSAKQNDTEFQKECARLKFYPDIDDVVLSMRYEYKINLPVIGTRTIIFTKMCAQRAWLHGAYDINDLIEGAQEIIKQADAGDESRIVYVTNYGIRYHRGNCIYLYKSKIETTLKQAKEDGYTPCKICGGTS